MVVMKKTLLHIALAVAATAFATSCVKELVEETTSTENTGKVEVTGQVFEGVMEDTKSVIEGQTPTWVEGDAISIFGSNQEQGLECTYLGENKFQSKESAVVEGPYFAIYPHKEGHTVNQETGVFTATVPSEQIITAGHNVGAGALVAVAASESTELYFRNAVGLVRLENKREDIVSIKIESTTSGQVIAGEFTMSLDGETPTVTPVADKGATSITLKPAEENGTLAAGEYYATLLPCSIDGLKVTFTRKNGEKTETATVTKTKATTIPRNGGANLGAFFSYEIKTAEDLLAWNKAAAKWTAWDVVTLNSETGVIDCADVITSENWTLNKFEGTFDGNNQTIDNLVIEKTGAASFLGRATGYAVIKNLTFGAGCSFTVTGTTGEDGMNQFSKNRTYAASVLSEASEHTRLINITNNGTITATAGSASNGNYFAGVCASHDGLEAIEGCKNYGSVTVLGTPSCWTNISGVLGQITKPVTASGCENYGDVQFNGTNSNNVRLNMGGMCGGIGDVVNFADCKNLGNISCNATAKHYGNVHIGGLVGYVDKSIIGTINNCSNGSATDATKGALSNNGECAAGSSKTNAVTIGGCLGFINGKNASISSFTNYGSITNTKSVSAIVALGGIVGYVLGTTENSIENCTNAGAVSNSGTIMDLYLGGIAGLVKNSNTNFDSITNTGAITNTGNITNTLSTGEITYIRLGGIVGCINEGTACSVTNANNTATIKNTKGGNAADVGNSIADLGGIIGKINLNGTSVGDDTSKGVKNSGSILNEGQSTDNGVAGIVGSITAATQSNTIKNCQNEGRVYRNGWANNKINGHGFGGILGYHFATGAATLNITSCENSGNISKVGGAASDFHIGGIVGSLFTSAATCNVTECTNKGQVTYENGTDWANNRYCYTGGIVGHHNSKGKISGCTNSGTITNKFATSAASGIRIGGIIGNALNGTIENCTNTGIVKDESTGQGGYVGGVAGWLASAATLTNCDNSGDISCKFNSETRSEKKNRSTICIGGVVGGGTNVINMSNCDNTGNIINNCSSNTAGGKTAMGGLVGFCNNNTTMTTCTTAGNITNNCSDTKNEYIGGLTGQIESNKTSSIQNCTITANLMVKVTTRDGNHFSGLVVGRLTDKVDGSGADATCSTTISNVVVKGGKYNDTPITADNLATYTFGHGSDYGGQGKTKGKTYATTGITFAE